MDLNNFKAEKAKQTDWKEILNLLEESNLIDRISGNGSFESFFIIKSVTDNKIISCFAINRKNDVGILKSFAVSKNLRGLGIGKNIVERIPTLGKELGLKKLYAASWEAPGFWTKTSFKEINPFEETEYFFTEYRDYLEKNYPQFAETRRYFLLFLVEHP